MKVLAIDTATQVCGAALSDEGQLVAEYRLNQKNVHNERLAPAIKNLVKDVGWQLPDLQGIAVSIGPGSFTGLRIGLAVAKSLAYTLDVPVAAVNTLDILASGIFAGDRDIAVIIKARVGEAYYARFGRKNNKVIRLTDYIVLKTEEVAESIKGSLVIANPYDLIAANEDWRLAPVEFCLSKPSVLAGLGYTKIAAGELADVSSLEPFYLKDFVPKKKKS